eukprot:gene36302-47242_t
MGWHAVPRPGNGAGDGLADKIRCFAPSHKPRPPASLPRFTPLPAPH